MPSKPDCQSTLQSIIALMPALLRKQVRLAGSASRRRLSKVMTNHLDNLVPHTRDCRAHRHADLTICVKTRTGSHERICILVHRKVSRLDRVGYSTWTNWWGAVEIAEPPEVPVNLALQQST